MKNYLIIIIAVITSVVTAYIVTRKETKPARALKVISVRNTEVKIPLPIAPPSYIKSIQPPSGYQLADAPANGFGQWLQQLPLRKDNTVYLYDGSIKQNQTAHYAVLDVPYNRHPLQQCADAIMRLRAEYIFETKAEENIRFYHQRNEYFTCPANCTRPQLEAFLNNVFNWCGSYNLQVQLKSTGIQNIQTGDVFVHGGSPGHAMLVAATAQNNKGEKVFLLLQSFMPAQDIHIVINPHNEKLSPWYSASEPWIATPGWNFTSADLRRW